MNKSVIITQSNYLPWKGYFDNIALADQLVLYDSVQYTRRDWRNRNKIKTDNGLKWLTVPVEVTGRFTQNIDETRIVGNAWAAKHWKTLQHSYGKLPGFESLAALFADLYSNMAIELLSDLNRLLIKRILDYLDISTTISSSSDFVLSGNRTEKLVYICKEIGADQYLSGPAAKAYLDETLFEDAGIEVKYFDNKYQLEYEQPYPPFMHQVSIVDLIACCANQSATYMKNTRK